ncbi:hypothetical protein FSP39_024726 [Pinctada imbricata]|uniref:Protein rolling stone-like n=1 Tax=Pinctada imbricata TaxID=66713 RepID=A0AA88Y5M0_PINIB|nr:hypothetical protein FSP39_024726 [Pinctada imbricata]
MFKVAAKFVHVTNDGVRMARRALGTYTRYAYYSLTDRKGRQPSSSSKTLVPYQPQYNLEYDSPEDFVHSQWSNETTSYLIYRMVVAAYFSFMVIYTAMMGTLGCKIFIMLTYWSFYVLTACQILRALNVWRYRKLKMEGKDIKEHMGKSKRLKVQWLLYNLSVDTAPIVTILFWTIAYDGTGKTFINLNTHGVNAVFILVDLMITRTPLRQSHMYQCCLVGLMYSFFTYLYWLMGGTNHLGQPHIYKVLDYGKAPGVALCYILAISFIVAPMIHSMIFFLYRFRIFIHRFLKAMDKRSKVVKDQE